jgi:hypothetical protein
LFLCGTFCFAVCSGMMSYFTTGAQWPCVIIVDTLWKCLCSVGNTNFAVSCQFLGRLVYLFVYQYVVKRPGHLDGV